MTNPPVRVGRLASISIDCPDPAALATFYSALVGMQQVFAADDGHFIALSDGTTFLTLVRAEDYQAPSWPTGGHPQQMHLDFAVDDLEVAVAGAEALGATLAAQQPNPAGWRVLLDPAGHPFCVTSLIPS